MTDILISPNNYRSQLTWMKRLAPLALLALVIFYEIVPAQWIDNNLGESSHLWAEIIFYGILGPLLAYAIIELMERWLEERETSDLQAKIMAQRQADVAEARELCDDAVQALFAASVLLTSLDAGHSPSTPQDKEHIQATVKMIDGTIQQLRSHLS